MFWINKLYKLKMGRSGVEKGIVGERASLSCTVVLRSVNSLVLSLFQL